MVEKHRQTLQEMAERLRPGTGMAGAIECKHFFSGAAAYVDGRIFVTLTSVGLALKLPPERRAELLKKGARPLRYFEKGPVKKDYVILPEALVDDRQALLAMMEESARYCRGLPEVRPKRSPKGNQRSERPRKSG
jgi:TfoX/Sxy family transcriptional regulator of competence genes